MWATATQPQRDNPQLRGKPVAVGGSRERGVVAAASYEAREFGVHSAMPSVTAKRRCPDLIFVTPRFDVYKAVSLQIRKIFAEYTAIIEPLSQTLPFLQQHFGKSGPYYYWIARGVDERPVRADRIRESVGAESTFAQDLHAFEPMREALQPIIAKVWRQCQATGARGRTVTLKVKFADFQQITRSKPIGDAIDSLAGLDCLSLVLLEPLLPTEKRVRLLGISLSSLTQAEATGRRQLSLVL